MKEHTHWNTANLGKEKGNQQKGLLLHFTDVLIIILIVHSHGFSVIEFITINHITYIIWTSDKHSECSDECIANKHVCQIHSILFKKDTSKKFTNMHDGRRISTILVIPTCASMRSLKLTNCRLIAEHISARLWTRDLFSQCTCVCTYVRVGHA